MEQLAAQLQQARLLRSLPQSVLEETLIPRGTVHTFTKDACIIAAQESVDRISIVLSGRIHLLHLFVDGRYSLSDVLTPGWALGLDLVCTRTRLAPYHAVAAEPCTVFSFPADLLLRPGQIPEIHRLALMDQLLEILSHQNIRKEYRLAILSQTSLRSRVLIYLSMQADRQQSATITTPFSREELAAFLCVNRSALSHELSKLQQEGYLIFRKRTFTLLHWQPRSEVY